MHKHLIHKTCDISISLEDVRVWRVGALGDGWRESSYTWKGMEVYKHVGMPKSR